MSALLPVLSLVKDDTGLQALAPEWDELLTDSTAGSIFLTWTWISTWRQTLGSKHELRVYTARHPDDDRLLGIAPLAVERRLRGPLAHRALVFLGSGPAKPDHLDLLVRRGYERTIAPALWEAACRRADWHLMDFDGLDDDSLLAQQLLRRRSDTTIVERIPAPYAELPDSWEAFEAALSRSLRQTMRRLARKLDREAPGPVQERLVVDPAEIESTIADIADLHQRLRQSRGDSGAFATPQLREFHRLAALRLGAAGRLRLHRLEIAGSTIAAGVCLRFGDTISGYTLGYDTSWSRYAPGHRIMARAVAGAIDEGAAVFDFLRGGEDYKDQWTNRTRHLLHIRRPVSPRGRILWALAAARRSVRSRWSGHCG